MKTVAAAVQNGDYELGEGGAVLVAAGHRLTDDDFSLELRSSDSAKGVATDDGIVVALDLVRTPRLVVEGHACDLNRSLQDLRKLAGLRYTDRIVVAVDTSEALWSSLRPHLGWLAEQLIAEKLEREDMPEPTASRRVDIAGESVVVALKRCRPHP